MESSSSSESTKKKRADRSEDVSDTSRDRSSKKPRLDDEETKLDLDIRKVEAQIEVIEKKIEVAEAKASEHEEKGDTENRDYWRGEKKQLRDEKKQLRDEKKQLIDRKNLLFQQKLTISSIVGHQQGFEFTFSAPKQHDAKSLINAIAINAIITTPNLASCLAELGKFPDQIFVRRHLFGLLGAIEARVNSKLGKSILIGSPGTGKSVLMVLLSVKLAQTQTVYMLKCVSDEATYLIKFSGDSVYGCPVKSDKLKYAVEIARNQGAIFFCDGYTQKNKPDGAVENCIVFGTSQQYVIRDEPLQRNHRTLSMPAWNSTDLFLFGENCLRLGKETMDEIFYYTGGSIRRFHRASADPDNYKGLICKELERACTALSDIEGALRGGGETSDKQVDLIRRLVYRDDQISDYISAPEAYVIDCGFVLRLLQDKLSLESFETFVSIARTFGGASYGCAFEPYCHKVVSVKKELVLNGLRYRFEHPYYGAIVDGEKKTFTARDISVLRGGSTKAECEVMIKQFAGGDSRYWYPDMPNLKTIDATCKMMEGNPEVPACVFIQHTVGKNHSFNWHTMGEYIKMYKHGGGTAQQFAYVAMLPEKNLVFKLDVVGTKSQCGEDLECFVAW